MIGIRLIASRQLTVTVLLLLAFSGADAAVGIPVSVPIKFGVEKSVEFSIIIDRHRNYYLDLALRFENIEERDLARKIIGDATSLCRAAHDCGEVSSFKITITMGDRIVFAQERQAYGHYAFLERAYLRNVLIIPLRPGTYEIRVEVTEFGSRLHGAKTDLVFTTDPREQDLGG